MNEINHQAVFNAVKTLVGKWSDINEDGDPAYIEYFLTANYTALVEAWSFHKGQTALTIYYMDRPTLMAMQSPEMLNFGYWKNLLLCL